MQSAGDASDGSTDVGRRTIEVKINVYDLLPPGKLASVLWSIGGAVLHSGVVVGEKEYAFGGHNRAGLSGVYWTKPGLEPPGGTFKCDISLGFALKSIDDIDLLIKEISHKFLGPSWNLLTNNCNHFTSYFCGQLTGRTTPAWLNRAASIGISMPCLIPKQWLSPPDAETADGELVEADCDDNEHTAMLKTQTRPSYDEEPDFVYKSSSESSDADETFQSRRRRRRRIYRNASKSDAIPYVDSSGRAIPVSERAPVTLNDTSTVIQARG